MLRARLSSALADIIAVFAFAASTALCCTPAQATPDASGSRIVSLMPSLTEDLFAIGAGPQIVGVSDFTDYPNAARTLPRVASFTSVDAERIARLHPTLVVGISAQAPLVRDLRRIGLRVELLPDDTLADLFTTLKRMGALSGRPVQAAQLAARLHARTAQLARSISPGPRPRTFVVLGTAPIFTIGDGSYIAELLALAGGRNASGVSEPYVRYDAEALIARNPDVIVADAQSGIRVARGREPWRSLAAVRAGRLYVLDDADILERPGPRYNEGLAWLIARLHPHAAK